MKLSVERYNLKKESICKGELEVSREGQETILNYHDEQINISVSELYHPIKALESLRKILETNYFSVIGINGCRIDTSYRATGHFGQYLIENGKQAITNVSMFEPTKEIDKLCTIEEHKKAYQNWYESLVNNRG